MGNRCENGGQGQNRTGNRVVPTRGFSVLLTLPRCSKYNNLVIDTHSRCTTALNRALLISAKLYQRKTPAGFSSLTELAEGTISIGGI